VGSFLRFFLAPCTMMMRNVLTLMRLGKGGSGGKERHGYLCEW